MSVDLKCTFNIQQNEYANGRVGPRAPSIDRDGQWKETKETTNKIENNKINKQNELHSPINLIDDSIE